MPDRISAGVRTRAAALAAAAAIMAATTGCGAGTAPEATAPAVEHPTADLTRDDVDAWLDGLLPAALEAHGIAGATVAVVEDGRTLTERGYGLADTRTRTPVDPAATLFRFGSVSKLVTATAVMRLVEDGDLDLDTDIAAYLDFDVPRGFDDDLTVRHLLTHTAGFEERMSGLIGTGADHPVDLRASLAADPPEQVYAPGTTPAYSNYGLSLAGYLVEHVSGMPFDDYVDTEIFAPLGMADASFRQPLPDDLAEQLASGYDDAAGEAEAFEMVNSAPAGSLSATASDMARFMIAHLDDEQSLLTDATRDLMHAPGLDHDDLGPLAAAPRMALGFFDESRNGHRILGHGGDTNVFHSHLQLYPDHGAGIVVSLNSTGTTPMATLDVRRALTDGFADRYFPGDGPDHGPVDDSTALEHAELAAGVYVTSRGFHSTFMSLLALADRTTVTALDEGRLRLDPGPLSQEPTVYEPVGPSLWREVEGQRTIALRLEDGEVTGIGHDNVFTLLPYDTDKAVTSALVVGAVAVLLSALAAWPIGALVRRRRGTAADPHGRLPRALTRAAMGAAVLALAGWAVVFMTTMAYFDAPTALIRAVQALQLAAAAGMVPAVWRLVTDLRHKTGWRRATANTAVLLSLSAVLSFAVEFHLLSPDISY